MDRGLISTRYARSLLDYAISLDQQDEVYNSLKTIINEDLNELFISEFERLRFLGFGEVGINRIIDRIDLLVNLKD